MQRNNKIYASISTKWNTDLRWKTTPINFKVNIEWIQSWKHLIFVNK